MFFWVAKKCIFTRSFSQFAVMTADFSMNEIARFRLIISNSAVSPFTTVDFSIFLSLTAREFNTKRPYVKRACFPSCHPPRCTWLTCIWPRDPSSHVTCTRISYYDPSMLQTVFPVAVSSSSSSSSSTWVRSYEGRVRARSLWRRVKSQTYKQRQTPRKCDVHTRAGKKTKAFHFYRMYLLMYPMYRTGLRDLKLFSEKRNGRLGRSHSPVLKRKR